MLNDVDAGSSAAGETGWRWCGCGAGGAAAGGVSATGGDEAEDDGGTDDGGWSEVGYGVQWEPRGLLKAFRCAVWLLPFTAIAPKDSSCRVWIGRASCRE